MLPLQVEPLRHGFGSVALLRGLVYFAIGIGLIADAWVAASPFTLRYPRLVHHVGRLITGWFRARIESFKPVAHGAGENEGLYHDAHKIAHMQHTKAQIFGLYPQRPLEN